MSENINSINKLYADNITNQDLIDNIVNDIERLYDLSVTEVKVSNINIT